MTVMQNMIDAIVNRQDFGEASAVKRGRNPEWPYVAVINNHMGAQNMTHNPMGRRAYATHEEAVAAAGRYIAVMREKLRVDLAKPNMRALRVQYNLPRDL